MKRAPVTPASPAEVEAALRRSEGATGKAKTRGARNFSIVTTIERARAEGAGLMTAYDRAAAQHGCSGTAVRGLWAEMQRFPRGVWEAACVPCWSDRERRFFVDEVEGLRDDIAAIILERRGLLSAAKVTGVAMAMYGIPPKHRSAMDRYVRRLCQQNRAEITIASNPDRARSLFLPAHGDRRQGLTGPFERFAYDGTAKPVMTTEGRGTIVFGIDEFSLRAVAVVGRSESGDLTTRLFARQCRDICVPRTVHSDRGAAFTSARLEAGFARLAIVHTTNPSCYAGYQNPFAEALSRLLSQFAALEHGYVGRDVAERQALRGRLSMSARRGKSESEILQVRLTDQELEEHLNRYLDLEADRPQERLGGKSSNQIISEWEQFGGQRRQIKDDEALAMLFAPTKQAIVGKRGICLQGRTYVAPALGALGGYRVEIRRYVDSGTIAVFSCEKTPRFLCIAADVLSLSPDERRSEALAARRAFRVAAKEIRRTSRRLVARLGGRSPAQILLNASVPSAGSKVLSVAFSTAGLVESARAAEAAAEMKSAERRGAESDPAARWAYYRQLRSRGALTAEEERWARVYEASADYLARIELDRAAS